MMYIWGSESAGKEGKVFTREVDDRTFSYLDFAVPVYQKRQWKWIQWKDVGQKMSIPMVAGFLHLIDQPSRNELSVLGWYRGLDEESGEMYQYLYRVNSNAIESINMIFGVELEVEVRNGIHALKEVEKVKNLQKVDALSFLFILQILWGKWEVRDEVLHGIKVTIPLIASTMQYQQTIQEIVEELRMLDMVIKMDAIESDDGVVIQLTSRDMSLLEQFALWHKPLASWSVISTKDFTQSLVSSLEEFLGKKIELAADQMIKIGTVQ